MTEKIKVYGFGEQEPYAVFEKDKHDAVTNPKHYQGKYGLQAMDVVRNFMWDLKGVAAGAWWNTMKYLLRFQKKNGIEDLKKARQNLDWLIAMEEEVD